MKKGTGNCLKCGFNGIKVKCKYCNHEQTITRINNYNILVWSCSVCNKSNEIDKKVLERIRCA